ncbi:DUF397 domain-containing protein [Haloactinospora alba]
MGDKLRGSREGRVTAVRDTRNRQAGYLWFSAAEWDALLADVRAERL